MPSRAPPHTRRPAPVRAINGLWHPVLNTRVALVQGTLLEVVRLGKASQTESAYRQSEVAQGNIEIAWNRQQVEDDAPQPGNNQVANPRLHLLRVGR
jgi:hypothetical protein